jgi:hypothetical protein
VAQRQFELVDRRVRLIQAPGMKAEVDAWAAGQNNLRIPVAEGRNAARQLRDTRGPALQARIALYEDKVDAHRKYQLKAVEAASLLAGIPVAAPRKAWLGPMEAWSANRGSALSLADELPSLADQKRRAEAELDATNEARAKLRSVVERGEAAEMELRRRIQAYLEEAIDADQVLPMWFDLALGTGIPRDNWPAWLHTAVDVVCYRIVYGVHDKLRALGDRPADEEQRAEYDRLTAECAAHRPH